VLTFALKVNDGTQDSALDTVLVTVNAAPVANAGPDTTVAEGLDVTLDGSGSSDPTGDQLTYTWVYVNDLTWPSATERMPTFTAPPMMGENGPLPKDSVLTFTLTVNDGTQNSAPDTVVVTVNAAPVADAGDDQRVDEGATGQVFGSGSTDPGDEELTYYWMAPEGIALLNLQMESADSTVHSPIFMAPDVLSDSVLTFELTVKDSLQSSAPDTVLVTVRGDNDAPTAAAGLDTTVAEGAMVTLDGSGSTDPEKRTLTYEWTAPTEIELSSTTVAAPTFTAPTGQNGSLPKDSVLTFALTVNDGVNDSAMDTVLVTVNAAPVAAAGLDTTVAQGATVTLSGSGTDSSPGDRLTYAWVYINDPTGTSPLSSTTMAAPTFAAPDELDSDSVLTFELTVNDGTQDSAPDTVVVTVNAAPVADAGDDQEVDEGATVTLSGSGTDSTTPSDQLTYAWTAPAGINLSDNTQATQEFTAPTGLVSTAFLEFTLKVNDGAQDSAPDTVVVTVYQTDRAALVALYNATDGANWDDNTNWNSSAALDTWRGVRTDDAGRVDSLNLRENSLSGSIPADLGDLTNLKYLNLQENDLTGPIPADLGDLTNLTRLYLQENSLSGPIPAELGDLTELRRLYLSDNKSDDNTGLTGAIPADLGNLTKLERLNLENNSLTGSIPAELGNLTELERLNLENNSLTGSIPAELGNLTKLEGLTLYNNSLTGAIPADLGNLTKLIGLVLYNNSLPFS